MSLNEKMEQVYEALADLEPEWRVEEYRGPIKYLSIPTGYLEALDISWSDEPTEELLINWLKWDQSGGLSDERELAVLPNETDVQTVVTYIRGFYKIAATEVE